MKTIINFYENGKTTKREDDKLLGVFTYDTDELIQKEFVGDEYFYIIDEDILHKFINDKFEIPYIPEYNTGNYTEFLEYHDSTIGITKIGIMLGDREVNEKNIARVLKIKSIICD